MSVGLFENDREANLDSTVAMIEDVLVELGHFLNDCRFDHPTSLRAWNLKSGSAQTLLVIVDRADFVYIVTRSAVMTVDSTVDQAALFRYLLELNRRDVSGAAFALEGNLVCLVAERSTLDLDRSEVLDMVKRIQAYADTYDDKLVKKYGGTIGGELS